MVNLTALKPKVVFNDFLVPEHTEGSMGDNPD